MNDLESAHEMQIETLTKSGLTNQERIERFADAAGFDQEDKNTALKYLDCECSPAFAVWNFGDYPESLFGKLPYRSCPVIERINRWTEELDGIPSDIQTYWNPTVETLRRFAEVQQGRRLKGVFS